MILLSLVLNLLGLAAIALGMETHGRELFARPPSPARRRTAKLAGGGLLGAAFVLAITTRGTGHGVVAWMAGLGAAGFLLALALAFCRKPLVR